jgi:DNA-binding CsgD family transcriptional regulator
MNQAKAIAGLTGGLTIGLAGAAFTLSFNSLTELAGQQGLSVPVLFPLILEGGLITFSLTALDRQLAGQSTVVQWAMVISCSIAAATFNIIHAPATLLARTMWAIPSVVLLLAFESFLTQLRYRVSQSTANSVDNSQSMASQQVNPDNLTPVKLSPVNRANQSMDNSVANRRERVLAALTEGLTIGQIAEVEGVSVGTIKNDKKALNGRVLVK